MPRVNDASFLPASDATAPAMAPAPEAPATAGAWLRALAFTLLAWATFLCVAFGSTTGVVTHTMAAKLAANALHFQRQAGLSSASRAARRDPLLAAAPTHALVSAPVPAQIAAPLQLPDPQPAALAGPFGAALPAAVFTLPADSGRASPPAAAACEPALRPRCCAHPSRAPPFLA